MLFRLEAAIKNKDVEGVRRIIDRIENDQQRTELVDKCVQEISSYVWDDIYNKEVVQLLIPHLQSISAFSIV